MSTVTRYADAQHRTRRAGYVEALADVLAKAETDGLPGVVAWIVDNADAATAQRAKRLRDADTQPAPKHDDGPPVPAALRWAPDPPGDPRVGKGTWHAHRADDPTATPLATVTPDAHGRWHATFHGDTLAHAFRGDDGTTGAETMTDACARAQRALWNVGLLDI